MHHLNDEELFHLAELVTEDSGFTTQDVDDMHHVGECDECFEKLQLYLAVIDASNSIDIIFSGEGKGFPSDMDENDNSMAVIQIVIVDANAIMRQLNATFSKWEFDAPLLFTGTRSAAGSEEKSSRIEDIDNGETFVAYDPSCKKLLIQIDCRNKETMPKAFLGFSDGRKLKIEFEKREHILWAEIGDLDNGEYQLILEK